MKKMIEFVFGREASAKTEYVKKKMGEALAQNKKCLLIIPEQQALFWDTVTAECFAPTDAFNIEAVSFKRLADSIFRRFGGSAKNYLNEAQRSLLMWNAIASVSPRLKAYKSPDREDRYVPLMLRGVNELKLYSITAEDIMDIAEKTEDSGSSLSLRLHDLSLIYAAYDALLRQSYDDPEEIPDALAKVLSEHDCFENTSVFIDSFYTLTPKEIKVVREIFRSADSTLLTFAMGEEDAGDPNMEYVTSYMKEMTRCASRLGLDVERTYLPDGRREVFSYLSANMWNYAAAPFEGDCSGISAVKCPDRYDEAVLAGAKIRELVAGGARFCDIACVSADFELYRGICDIELERQGIPVYVSGKTSVTSQPALRLLLSAANVCAGGWKREDMVALSKTGLCSLTADETDAFEIYTEKWRIRGKKKYCGDPWAMNADGYSLTQSPRAHTMMTLANVAKEKLAPPIEAFYEVFPGTVKDACTAAYKLLCDFSVYSQLKSEVALLEAAGKLAEAQKKSQVWGALISVLDTLALCVPDAVVDARRFAALLRHTADTCHIGSIPDGIDRVVLGSVGSVRLDSIKHLIILGAKSGEFPRVPKETGFFGDRDRQILLSHGIEISPDTEKRRREEMFRFTETVCAPSETLTLMIPSSDGECHPSMGALRLTALVPHMETWDFTVPEGERVIRLRGSSDEALSEAPLSADNDRTTGAALARLFDKDINLTQTKIECFTACAFKYYCRHILHLDEGGKASLKPSEVGTFVHSVLEHFMKDAVSSTFPLEESAVISKTERLIREYKEKVKPSGEQDYADYLFDRLTKSINLFARALNEEFAQSRFTPYSFELEVGFSKDLPALPIRLENGHDLTVRGVVDRVDILRENGKVYIRVVDYKTGPKTFSLTKALRGENIQLLLYLFALCNMPSGCTFAKKLLKNGERLVPAGAVYFSARPGDITSGELLEGESADTTALHGISRTGIVLGEAGVISAMDKDMAGRFAPAYFDKKNRLKGCYAENEKAFDDIKKTIDGFLKEVGDKLSSGFAASCPTGYGPNSACTYCSMKPICRHSGHTAENESEKGDNDGE
ncbi:MAG: PD-(D/E)XK nuclease family protein [Clostridia bacterium]|nr:PD-(D/E)XK nuclease family protein [Clostridia bacterium]